MRARALRAIAVFSAVALFFVSASSRAAEDASVTEIRKEYDSIRKAIPSMTSESMEALEPSTEGGEVTAYRTDGHIRFIRSELYFESGKEIEEYYYKNGKLIFTLYEEHHYNVPMYVTPKTAKETGSPAFDPKKTTITANRYYYKEDRLIRWLDEKKSVPAKNKEYADAEKNVLEASKKVYGQFAGETDR